VKKFLVFLIICFISTQSFASIAYVSVSSTGSAQGPFSSVASASLSTTTGNALVITITMANVANVTVSSVSDTAGDTFIHQATCYENFVANSIQSDIWYALNITGNASNIVTANFSTATQYPGIAQVQYSGIPTYPRAICATASGTTATITAVINPPQSNGLIVSTINPDCATTISPGAHFTQRATPTSIQDYVGAPAGSNNVTAAISPACANEMSALSLSANSGYQGLLK
jgi:hypothetical protein